MQEWQYKTLIIQPSDDEVSTEIDHRIGQIGPDGWEYLSGPVIDRHDGQVDYVFVFRRPAPRTSAYADHGVEVI